VQSISRKHFFSRENSTTAFIAVLASFVGYAALYYETSKGNDRFQSYILASVNLAGFAVALSLGFGPLISTFCVAPRAIIVGLLVSDLAHCIFPVLQRRDEEMKSNKVHGVASKKF
jgi:hypothetical protein